MYLLYYKCVYNKSRLFFNLSPLLFSGDPPQMCHDNKDSGRAQESIYCLPTPHLLHVTPLERLSTKTTGLGKYLRGSVSCSEGGVMC